MPKPEGYVDKPRKTLTETTTEKVLIKINNIFVSFIN